MSKGDLTAKQKQFCEEYLIDLNATQAAIRAGYSQKTARTIAANLLAKMNIKDYVQGLMDKRADKTLYDQEYVINGLLEVHRRCMEGEFINPAGANKALELLGKHKRMFVDKVEIEGELDLNHKSFEQYIEVKKQAQKELSNEPNNRIKSLGGE